MKAIIKDTGEIINIDEYAKVTLDKCDSYGDPIELSFDEVEIIYEPTDKEQKNRISDMPSERRMRYEIAKAALQGILSHAYMLIAGDAVMENSYLAIRYADETIKQLKEKAE